VRANKIVVIAIVVVIGSSVAFLFITRAPTMTTSLSCEGARTVVMLNHPTISQNHTTYETQKVSTRILPDMTFTTTTNVSSSIGQVVTSTSTFEDETFGIVIDWIAMTCTYVK